MSILRKSDDSLGAVGHFCRRVPGGLSAPPLAFKGALSLCFFLGFGFCFSFLTFVAILDPENWVGL